MQSQKDEKICHNRLIGLINDGYKSENTNDDNTKR
jgi:hypothetical protein